MQTITHEEQRDRWEAEHSNPTVLLQMDATTPSSGVVTFFEWLEDRGEDAHALRGLEVCCGKGRSSTWLASQGIDMFGLDFSPTAIKEATKRAVEAGVADKTHFIVHDVTLPYPVAVNSFDFVIDCFGSTDIESPEGRLAALRNTVQALRPGGYLLTYLLSTDDEFHKEMIKKSPGPDAGSFLHPTNGKYEKAFTEDEVREFYNELDCVAFERLPKKAIFFGQEYDCTHIWAVFQK